MHVIDWVFIAIPLLASLFIAFYTARYAKSVAGFLSAERCAGRYLICNSRGEASFGAVSAVAAFQLIYGSGLTVAWWNNLSMPIFLLIALSGFVIYRYRETRALTLAQFFEIRYSKLFRIFAGIIAFVAGVLNYGVFPGVSARLMVYLWDLPESFFLGSMQIPTFAPVMVLGLLYALFLTLSGGQITIMVTDCFLGILSGILYIIICVSLLSIFGWDQISSALANQPAGHSLLDPFASNSIQDFNIWYVLIGIFTTIYGTMAWQGGHGYNSAAATPHEAKMASILGSWRGIMLGLCITLLGLCAYTFLNHPDFASGASVVTKKLSLISDPQIKDQMRIPIALAELLPIGIRGMLCAIMLFAWVAIDSSFLHSWGSILIQDVILPFRKIPFATKTHIQLLRCAIIGVAIFGFVFSLLFRQTEYLFMYFAITGAIFIGGAGAAIIGGLYWKKGTTAGAWTGLIVGSGLSVGGIIFKQIYPEFPVNGQWLAMGATLCAAISYVGVSILTHRKNFDMERMLHRGAYALNREHSSLATTLRSRLSRLIGIDNEYSCSDRWIAGGLFAWSMLFFISFIVIMLWNLISRWPIHWWANYWYVAAVILPLFVGSATTLWMSLGGIRDMRKIFPTLASRQNNQLDDGMVINHHNLNEK